MHDQEMFALALLEAEAYGFKGESAENVARRILEKNAETNIQSIGE